MNVVLDSWPVLALLGDEKCDIEAIESALEGQALMSWVNAVEVSYLVARDNGPDEGRAVLSSLQRRVRLVMPDEDLMRRVVDLKTSNSVSLGDCFAIATAAANAAQLYTGDPEILGAEGLPCSVVDVR